ncbi:MAG: lipooligosaccharide sialyltransferase [Lachnospiraceae bacterium]|nr:lipooligosaccharide sialyltransferase [Lachnospiraceae bacterium]
MKKGRIYVCHTFYHVYISFLKEFALPEAEKGNASIVLSKMSNDFGDIAGRIVKSGYFKETFEYDEKRDTEFPELAKYRKDRGNILLNMIPRIIFTSKYAKLQEAYVPVDFREYDEVYVFCDNDPIGVFLNKKRIHYHAVEDGLNYLASFVNAKADNKGGFAIKKFMSMKLNLIFMQDGYSKYCDDMEVNDLSVIDDDFYKYKEVPRAKLEAALDDEKKETLVRVFVKDIDKIREGIQSLGKDSRNILILTEPLCTLDVRERIFRDLSEQYGKEGLVFFKVHPRDELDYDKLFPDIFRFDKRVPMELLNFFPGLHFNKVVSVFTQLGSIKFADEKVYLGVKFMDKYEDPSVHGNIVENEAAIKADSRG